MLSHLLATRFGTGLSPDHSAPEAPEALLNDLAGPDSAAAAFPVPGWDERMVNMRAFFRTRNARNKASEADAEAANEAFRAQRVISAETYSGDLAAALARASVAPTGFRDRLVWFWADHFAVLDGPSYRRSSVGAYYDAAIRPHVGGPFATLLRNAATHPAMLSYLDQERSIGPNSPRGRDGGGGLNENLARELLELHTLGVDGPYGQEDVRQLAELLTGLSISKEGEPRFRRNFAEPGAETVLGRSYGGDQPNRHDIGRVLDDLAVHSATARHLSRKLAVHFVADDPPVDLVDAMQAAWLRSNGDLTEVYRVLTTHPAALSPDQRKVRRPLDLVAAAARATGRGPALPGAGRRVLRRYATQPLEAMGQTWLRPPGPQGWPEEAAAWITPQGLAARLDWAQTVGEEIDTDPRAFLDVALGPLASSRTRFAVGAAEDRPAGIALVLAAPEFQRR
ncbi:MAG: DUF1800 domain-containing protein [Pseudomonadota bacterium]